MVELQILAVIGRPVSTLCGLTTEAGKATEFKCQDQLSDHIEHQELRFGQSGDLQHRLVFHLRAITG